MKTMKLISITGLLVLMTLSCNQQAGKEKEKKSGLHKEMNDVKEAVKDSIRMEKEQLKMNIKELINSYDSQIKDYNNRMEKKNEQMTEKAKESMARLETQKDSLNVKLSKIEKQSKENWDEFRAETEHDLNKFGEGVKSFFTDDK